MRTKIEGHDSIREYLEEVFYDRESDTGSQMELITGVVQALALIAWSATGSEGFGEQYRSIVGLLLEVEPKLRAIADPQQLERFSNSRG